VVVDRWNMWSKCRTVRVTGIVTTAMASTIDLSLIMAIADLSMDKFGSPLSIGSDGSGVASGELQQ